MVEFGGVYTLDEIEPLIPLHPNCLADPKTPIYTVEGWKEIKDVQVGDFVLTHKLRFRRVMQIHHTPAQLFAKLVCIDGHVTLTSNHPILIGRKWVKAGNVQCGDELQLLRSVDLPFVSDRIFSMKKWTSHRKNLVLYNLSVNEDESYVAAGVVVHNCRCVALPLDVTDMEEAQRAEEGMQFVMEQPELGEISPLSESDITDHNPIARKFDRSLLRGVEKAGGFGTDDTQKLKAVAEHRLQARLASSPRTDDYQYFTSQLQQFFPNVTPGEWPLMSSERRLITSWAMTSSDKSELAMLLQRAAAEEFNLIDASVAHFDRETFAVLAKRLSAQGGDRIMSGARAFLREMYNETQAAFQEAGITELPVYRGVVLEAERIPKHWQDALSDRQVLIGRDLHTIAPLGTVADEMLLQPISSFSVDVHTAVDFVKLQSEKRHGWGVVIAGKVPVSRMLAVPGRGFGSFSEYETVVLGGRMNFGVVFSKKASIIDRMSAEDLVHLVVDANEKLRILLTPKLFNITAYPADFASVTAAQRLAQASWDDIKTLIEQDLEVLRVGDYAFKPIKEGAKFTAKQVDVIIDNMKRELGLYRQYLAGDTMELSRDFIDDFARLLRENERAFRRLNAATLNEMGRDSVRKMVMQEIESNRQQFTDHGIRHLVGNVQRQEKLFDLLDKAGLPVAPMDRLQGMFVMVNHDVGYTVPLTRAGGLRGIMASSEHPLFSSQIASQQRALWDIRGKVFSEAEYERVLQSVLTHSQSGLDPTDVLSFTTRLADNTALFAREKLPGMFRYVEGAEDLLVQMGMAAKNKDELMFGRLKGLLDKAVDETERFSPQLRRDLKAGVREISMMTPKFTMGSLGGEMTDVYSTAKSLVVLEVEASKWDVFLARYFDMGQQQVRKLVKDYGAVLQDNVLALGEYQGRNVLEIRLIGSPLPQMSDVVKASGLLTEKSPGVLRYAKMFGLSYDDAVAEIEKNLGEMLQDASVWVRESNTRVLRQILKDGRLKTQFETQMSSGVFDQASRNLLEQAVVGITGPVPRNRPVYGYLTAHLDGDLMTDVDVALKQYGDIAVRLKSKTRSFTTFTIGDSLDENIHVLKGWAITDDPKILRALYTHASSVEDPRWYTANNFHGDVLEAIRSKSLDRLKRTRVEITGHASRYLEAQVHGGVTLEDIAEIVFADTAKHRAWIKANGTLLEKHGIKWRFAGEAAEKEVVISGAERGLVPAADAFAACVVGGGIGSYAAVWSIYKRPSACTDVYKVGEKWFHRDEEVTDLKLLGRIKRLVIPPAWANVVVAADPAAKIQAIGRIVGADGKDHWQYRYLASAVAKSARKKFARARAFERDMAGIRMGIDRGVKSGNTHAMLLRLEDQTAIRVGSREEQLGAVKAYGLTTLLSGHVRIEGDRIILDFVAKKGAAAHYEIEDKILAGWLKRRKTATAAGARLFPDVDADSLNAYLQDLARGRHYTIKDFRTYYGTLRAREALRLYARRRLSLTERRRAVREVSTLVSEFLRNTPAVARSAYINPMVWEIIGGLP